MLRGSYFGYWNLNGTARSENNRECKEKTNIAFTHRRCFGLFMPFPLHLCRVSGVESVESGPMAQIDRVLFHFLKGKNGVEILPRGGNCAEPLTVGDDDLYPFP